MPSKFRFLKKRKYTLFEKLFPNIPGKKAGTLPKYNLNLKKKGMQELSILIRGIDSNLISRCQVEVGVIC